MAVLPRIGGQFAGYQFRRFPPPVERVLQESQPPCGVGDAEVDRDGVHEPRTVATMCVGSNRLRVRTPGQALATGWPRSCRSMSQLMVTWRRAGDRPSTVRHGIDAGSSDSRGGGSRSSMARAHSSMFESRQGRPEAVVRTSPECQRRGVLGSVNLADSKCSAFFQTDGSRLAAAVHRKTIEPAGKSSPATEMGAIAVRGIGRNTRLQADGLGHCARHKIGPCS